MQYFTGISVSNGLYAALKRIIGWESFASFITVFCTFVTFLSVSDRELIEQFLYKVAMMAPLCGGIVFEDSIPLEFHYAKDVFLFR